MASPRALVEASFDDGATWVTVAADVPLDAYGAATLDWPIDQTGTGVIVRATVQSGLGAAVVGASEQPIDVFVPTNA